MVSCTYLKIYKILKKVRAVGLEPTRISPFDLKSNAFAGSATLVFCGRNVSMTSLASIPPSYSFHHTYSPTIFFKLCRDEERIYL